MKQENEVKAVSCEGWASDYQVEKLQPGTVYLRQAKYTNYGSEGSSVILNAHRFGSETLPVPAGTIRPDSLLLQPVFRVSKSGEAHLREFASIPGAIYFDRSELVIHLDDFNYAVLTCRTNQWVYDLFCQQTLDDRKLALLYKMTRQPVEKPRQIFTANLYKDTAPIRRPVLNMTERVGQMIQNRAEAALSAGNKPIYDFINDLSQKTDCWVEAVHIPGYY